MPESGIDLGIQRGARRSHKTTIIAGAAVVAVVAIGVGLRSRSEAQLGQWTREQAVPSVSVIAPQTAQSAGDLTLPANLRAFNTAPIYARSNGYVRRWLVDIGEPVRRGQLLAIIEAPEVDEQLAAARADLKTALANENLARTSAQRWQALLAKDAVSQQETDERKGELAARTAVSDAARANVARILALKGFTRLIAPFDGVVTTRSVEVGALVSSGNSAATPLFTVANVHRIRGYVQIPQAYAGQVRSGMQVKLVLPDYPGRSFDATLTGTAGAVDPRSGTMLVQVQAENPDRALRPGSYAQATFPLDGASNRLTLPPSALVINDSGTRIALLGPGGKAVLHPVKLGRDRGTVVEIETGLKADDRVINNPPESLATGDAVRVLASEGNADAAR